MTAELVTVYYTEYADEAEFVVYWLADRGIAAAIRNWFAFSETATESPVFDAPDGIEVCCDRSSDIVRAIHLLKTELALPGDMRSLRHGKPSVAATCGACGYRGTFYGSQAGSVQACENCEEFLDVPGEPGR